MKSLTLIFLGLLLLGGSSNVRATEVTLCDNVKMWLQMYSLNESVEIVDCTSKSIVMKPLLRSDGTYDLKLWNSIQDSRKVDNSKWIHDNTVFSWLQRNGKYSYRQNSRPSAQVSFHDFKDGVAMRIKIDFDRFAPGGNRLIDSARHFIQELSKNLIFRKETDQDRMKPSLQTQYQKKMGSAGNTQD